jgi:hypothetical protein
MIVFQLQFAAIGMRGGKTAAINPLTTNNPLI